MDQQLMDKLYGGFLGMNVGIRLGAPVEPRIWTVERIARTYGDIRSYVKEYKHFAADDDANGPVFFLRALEDIAAVIAYPVYSVAGILVVTMAGVLLFREKLEKRCFFDT